MERPCNLETVYQSLYCLLYNLTAPFTLITYTHKPREDYGVSRQKNMKKQTGRMSKTV